MKQGLGLLGLVAIVLFSAQTVSRDRANVGPTASTSTLPALTVGFIDAGTIVATVGINSVYDQVGIVDAGSILSAYAQLGIVDAGSLLVTGNEFVAGTITNTANVNLGNGCFAAGTGAVTLSCATTTGTNVSVSTGANGNIMLGAGSGYFDAPSTSAGYKLASRLVMIPTTPTISSGFGSSPSISAGITTAAFRVNVGTGGVATSGVIGLATATTGWNCYCTDITTRSTTVFHCLQTASSTTSATIGNFNTSAAAAAWVASDIIAVSCFGY